MLGCSIRVAVATFTLVGALLVGHAAAEEHRNVPRTGVSLTYKAISTTNIQDATAVHGQSNGWKYRYRVRSSDGVTAEGPVELTTVYLALDPRLPPPARDASRRALEQLKARKDGDLYAVDIQPEVTRALAKLGAFRWLYFIPELSQTAFPKPGKVGFDPTHAQVTAVRTQCDKATLESFFPIGKSSHVSVPCTQSVDVSHVQPPAHDIHSPKRALIIDLTYEGQGKVTTEAGEWPVRKIRMTSSTETPSSQTETEILFSEQLGAIVKQHSVTKTQTGNMSVTAQTDRELIAVAQ